MIFLNEDNTSSLYSYHLLKSSTGEPEIYAEDPKVTTLVLFFMTPFFDIETKIKKVFWSLMNECSNIVVAKP